MFIISSHWYVCQDLSVNIIFSHFSDIKQNEEEQYLSDCSSLLIACLFVLVLEILLYGASPKCEDVDQQALTYSEIKALCTGDERIKEKLMLDNEVKELKTLSAEYANTVYEMQDKIKAFPMKEEQLTTALSNLQADRKALKALPIDPETKLPVFKMKIGDVEYTDKKEAAKALEDVALSIRIADTPVKVGEFQGFPLSITVHSPDSNDAGRISALCKADKQFCP